MKPVCMAVCMVVVLGLLASPAPVRAIPCGELGGGYTLLQLGNNGGDPTSSGSPSGGDKLEITSNSSVFGDTLKGVDDKPEKNKITTSKVTGAWDREDGVENDFSSAYTGTQNDLSPAEFDTIANAAVAASGYWAGQAATDLAINLNGTTMTITGSSGGGNIYNVTDGFILNSDAKLILDGGVGDYFVFNISEDYLFSIQSHSIIELAGDITADEVRFHVMFRTAGLRYLCCR